MITHPSELRACLPVYVPACRSGDPIIGWHANSAIWRPQLDCHRISVVLYQTHLGELAGAGCKPTARGHGPTGPARVGEEGGSGLMEGCSRPDGGCSRPDGGCSGPDGDCSRPDGGWEAGAAAAAGLYVAAAAPARGFYADTGLFTFHDGDEQDEEEGEDEAH